MNRIILILLALVVFACSQTIPKYLIWDYSYQNTIGQSIDSTDIDFQVYRSVDNINFQQLTVKPGPQQTVDLWNFPELFGNTNQYFYLTARQISNNMYSAHSDTVYDYFAIPQPRKPSASQIVDTLRVRFP